MSASKRKYTNSLKDQQMLVLQEMQACKDLLFGKFNNFTKENIADEWNRIATYASGLGIIADSNGEKFRRITWQNWRRSVMNKVEKMKQNSLNGSCNKVILDENDKMILSIVGENITEEDEDNDCDGTLITHDSVVAEIETPFMDISTNSWNPPAPKKKASSSSKAMEFNDLRLEYQKLCCYEKRLKIREMELRLNILPSEYTTCLYENKLDVKPPVKSESEDCPDTE